jgi:hypothetical protein
MSIGADDANLRRQYERMWIMLEPPMSERRVCSVAPGATMQTCHTESEVDEQRRQQQLDAIDQKYNAPK